MSSNNSPRKDGKEAKKEGKKRHSSPPQVVISDSVITPSTSKNQLASSIGTPSTQFGDGQPLGPAFTTQHQLTRVVSERRTEKIQLDPKDHRLSHRKKTDVSDLSSKVRGFFSKRKDSGGGNTLDSAELQALRERVDKERKDEEKREREKEKEREKENEKEKEKEEKRERKERKKEREREKKAESESLDLTPKSHQQRRKSSAPYISERPSVQLLLVGDTSGDHSSYSKKDAKREEKEKEKKEKKEKDEASSLLKRAVTEFGSKRASSPLTLVKERNQRKSMETNKHPVFSSKIEIESAAPAKSVSNEIAVHDVHPSLQIRFAEKSSPKVGDLGTSVKGSGISLRAKTLAAKRLSVRILEEEGGSTSPRFSDVAPPQLLCTLASFEVARQEIIFELICTEKQYINQLVRTVNEYLNPMRDRQILDKKEIDAIFSNLEELITINQNILKSLETQQESGAMVIMDVGSIFLDNRMKLKQYATFCSNQRTSFESIEKFRETNQQFNDFLSENRRSRLEAMLILPTQRLYRYPLFIENLLRATPSHHPDYFNLIKALVKIKEIGTMVDEKLNRAEKVMKLTEIQQSLIQDSSNPIDIVSNDRCLVREFTVKLGNFWGKNEAQVFLFSDLLLVTKASRKGLKPTRCVNLKELLVRPLDSEGFQLELVFSGGGLENWAFENRDKRDSIYQTIQDLRARLLFFTTSSLVEESPSYEMLTPRIHTDKEKDEEIKEGEELFVSKSNDNQFFTLLNQLAKEKSKRIDLERELQQLKETLHLVTTEENKRLKASGQTAGPPAPNGTQLNGLQPTITNLPVIIHPPPDGLRYEGIQIAAARSASISSVQSNDIPLDGDRDDYHSFTTTITTTTTTITTPITTPIEQQPSAPQDETAAALQAALLLQQTHLKKIEDWREKYYQTLKDKENIQSRFLALSEQNKVLRKKLGSHDLGIGGGTKYPSHPQRSFNALSHKINFFESIAKHEPSSPET